MILRTTTIRGPGIIGKAPPEPTVYGLRLSETPTKYVIQAIREHDMQSALLEKIHIPLEKMERHQLNRIVIAWAIHQQRYHDHGN